MPTPFISQQDLSDYIGRDVTADDGALAAVDAASEVCRTIAEQTFDQVIGDIATLDGTGTDCLLLPELPVASAGTVSVAGSAITDYVLADNGRLIRQWPQGTTPPDWWWWSDWWWGWPYVPTSPGYVGQWAYQPPSAIWPMGRQNVQVTYDHGYGTVPSDVRMVALTFAARLVIQGVAVYESVGGQSVRYAGPAMDLTAGEKAILKKHRPTR